MSAPAASAGRCPSLGRAEVHGICAGKRDPKPSVIAALTRTAAGWQFVNFYYPGVSDLLRTLKLLHQEHH